MTSKNQSVFDFIATRRCQANPSLSGLAPLSLLELVTLRILPSLRFKARTLYSYSTFKVHNLPSSAVTFQFASKLNSYLSNTTIIQKLKVLCCKVLDILTYLFGQHNWRREFLSSQIINLERVPFANF